MNGMNDDKDDRLLISIETDLTRGWFFTYLHMTAEVPGLRTTNVIRLKPNYYKRHKQLLDAYIYAHDNKTALTLSNAREWANFVENQYMILLEDGKMSSRE